MGAELDILRRPKLPWRRVISLIEQSVECLDHKCFVGFLLGFHNSDFVKDVLLRDLLNATMGWPLDIPFRSATARMTTIPETGHLSPLEVPDKIASEIRAFFRG